MGKVVGKMRNVSQPTWWGNAESVWLGRNPPGSSSQVTPRLGRNARQFLF